jgi:hypothetical protein
VENPRYLKEELPALRRSGRAVSRKKKGGHNRRKAVQEFVSASSIHWIRIATASMRPRRIRLRGVGLGRLDVPNARRGRNTLGACGSQSIKITFVAEERPPYSTLSAAWSARPEPPKAYRGKQANKSFFNLRKLF